MAASEKFTPASFGRAFFFFALMFAVGVGSILEAQPGYRPQPEISTAGQPDQAEGRRVLEQFRGLGIPGSYYLEFQLRVMPRRGEEHLLQGRLWGMLTEKGPAIRVTLGTAGGDHRLLILDGADSAVWQHLPGEASTTEKMDVAALFAPLAQTDLTTFDLQRPYLGWKDFVYEGITRVRGRPAYKILLYPPADFSATYPALTGVRVYLDTAFKAMVQSEQIGKTGVLLKSMGLQELKKIGEQWIPKAVDLRDEVSRNKTRLNITGAALNQDFIGDLFSPSSLGEKIASPPVSQITRIAP